MFKHKIKGFMTALILAAVSFFVIGFLYPDFSERVLGVRLRKTSAVNVKTEQITEMTERVSADVLKMFEN